MSKAHFTKMQGCGNSFVLILSKSLASEIQRENPVIPKICSPQWGIGSDGLFVVQEEKNSLGAFVVAMFNPDGSTMGMCGNGARCVARFLFDRGLVAADEEIALEIEGRVVRCRIDPIGGSVSVLMGTPEFCAKLIPVTSNNDTFINQTLVVGDELRFPHVTAVSMGNPHCVIFLDEHPENFRAIGRKIEHHQAFPERVNVEFVTRPSDDLFDVLVWERGAGATLACGSGACAVVAAAVMCERAIKGKRYTVKLPGGELFVSWEKAPNTIVLTGPATKICEGTLSLPL